MLIFISYSHVNASLVTRLRQLLIDHGAEIWIDHEALPPATPDWQRAIRTGLRAADVVVYAASSDALDSVYVQAELNIAYDFKKRIIPFWLEGEKWSSVAPFFLTNTQHIDARDGRFEAGERALLKALGLEVPSPRQPIPQPPPSPQIPPTSPTPIPSTSATREVSRRKLLATTGAGVAILVTAGGATWWILSRSTHSPQGSEHPPRWLWQFPTGGYVVSSPAVADGVVFVGSFNGYFYAVDATTGMQRWQFKTGFSVTSSPTLTNGVVYVGSYDTFLYALDAATGTQRWRFPTGGPVEGSPTVAGGVVYVGSHDHSLYALDATKGSLLWRFQTGDEVEGPPTLTNGVVYVGSTDTYLYALDAATGTQRWRFPTGGAIASSPLVSDGVVFVGSVDKFLYSVDARN
jgi:hypothetical protein